MSNKTEDEDYIEQWRRLLAMRRALTPLERFLIVIVVSTFVTVVGCLLLCLTYRRAALVRRYYKKKKLSKHDCDRKMCSTGRHSFEGREQQCVVHTISHSGIIITPPPSYDSIVQSARSPYLNDARKYSIGAMSDSGTTVANVVSVRATIEMKPTIGRFSPLRALISCWPWRVRTDGHNRSDRRSPTLAFFLPLATRILRNRTLDCRWNSSSTFRTIGFASTCILQNIARLIQRSAIRQNTSFVCSYRTASC